LHAHECNTKFLDTKANLEGCRAEAMLRLFIAEHCSTV